MVETVTLDGFPYRTLGDAYVLLVQDPQEALSPEDLERLRAGLPEQLGARTVRAEGRGALHVFELPVEPDLAGLEELLAGAPVHRAGAAPAGPARGQPARPQAAALRHHGALARAHGRA